MWVGAVNDNVQSCGDGSDKQCGLGLLTIMYNHVGMGQTVWVGAVNDNVQSCGDGSDKQCGLGLLTIMYYQMEGHGHTRV